MILQSGVTFLHDLNLTFFEVITILGVLGGLVGIWIATKVQIAKLETKTQLGMESMRTEFDIKIKAIDSKTVGLADFLNSRLNEFVASNREDHSELKESITHITDILNEVNIKIAKITP